MKGVGMRKTALFVLLVSLLVGAFVFAAAGTAWADVPTNTPTVIETDGASVFKYADLVDISGGVVKYQGGYARFNNATVDGYASNGASYSVDPLAPTMSGKGPHGGYDTTTNKCKVCHAVHRAEGAYYLLRADTQDDACDYCHIGGSAHSAKVVYSANNAGIYTPNGHTMGAKPKVPDSTSRQWVKAVRLSTVASDNVTVIETDVMVRQYETTSTEMYRLAPRAHSFTGHPLESGSPVWGRVGPLALRCMSCHQVHNAKWQVWRPKGTTETAQSHEVDGNGFLLYGYKLLRRFPSASVSGDPTPGQSIPTTWLAKVPESTLTADVNYSTMASVEATYTENDITARQPVWVVHGLTSGTRGEGFHNPEYTTIVNQFTLSIWCADCHNLNVGTTAELGEAGLDELGFHAHAERTHPVPYAHGGQCYSCHRNDLGGASTGFPNATSCSRCHYSWSTYRTDHATSDFPHSGNDAGFKLLGAYSAVTPTDGPYTYSTFFTTQTADTLDAVCLRCHNSIGVHN